MFVSLLKILIFSLVSIGMGFLAAVGLREWYDRLYPEGEKNEEETDETDKIEPVFEDPIEKPEESEKSEELEETAPEVVFNEPEAAAEPEEEKKPILPETETKSGDGFDDHGLLPKSFKVDSIINDMLDESVPEVPEDLSAVIDREEKAEPEDYTVDFEDSDGDFGDEGDEDMLARALENAGSAAESTDGNIDFDDENFLDRVAEETYTHREISPMAVELLGEDFNFEALLADENRIPVDEAKAPSDAVGSETVEPQIAFREWEDGTFQAESECYTDDVSLLELLPGEQDIVSVFPEEWVRQDVIEPDTSAEAEKMSFVEESRPMFVRKTKKRPY